MTPKATKRTYVTLKLTMEDVELLAALTGGIESKTQETSNRIWQIFEQLVQVLGNNNRRLFFDLFECCCGEDHCK